VYDGKPLHLPSSVYPSLITGSAPPEKHSTIVNRLSQTTKTALFFHTTSVASRSSPAFSRSCHSSILPSFVAECFTHAVQSVNAETYHHPVGEADGICVSIANDREGYIFSLDSDYLILVSTPGASRVKGYCPLDMFQWIEGEVAVPNADEDGWETPKKADEWSQAGSSSRSKARSKTGSTRYTNYLPSPTYTSPTLVLTSISPAALRTRLRLPANVMPLFASLVGNDYTPPKYADLFYEPGLSPVQKIEKAGRILREVIYAPNSAKAVSGVSNAGDKAVLMVKRVVTKLATRVHLSESVIDEMVDTIIESTFQYVLPGLPDQSATYPFDDPEQTDPEAEAAQVTQAKERYATLQRVGKAGHITHAYTYPGRIYLWPLMEDPSGPSLRASEGVRRVRIEAWRLLEEGCGGLGWPEPTEEDLRLAQEDAELEKLLGDTGITNGEDAEQEVEGGDETPAEVPATPGQEEDIAAPDLPKERPRRIIEWVRQGSSSKHTGVSVSLPPPPEQSAAPTCLAPMSTRLSHYLRTLSSDTLAVQALPPHLHPLIAAVRLSIIESAARSVRNDTKWRRAEVVAVLKGGLGMYAAWEKEERVCRPEKDSEVGGWPQLGGRQMGIVTQLGAVMLDALLLAQALLLGPEEVYGDEGEGEGTSSVDAESAAAKGQVEKNGHSTEMDADAGDSRQDGRAIDGTPEDGEDENPNRPRLTHLTPFVFVSGIALHHLLENTEPPASTGWRWSAAEDALLERCLEAVGEGLEDNIVGWSGATTRKALNAHPPSPESSSRAKEKSKKKDQKKNPPEKISGGSRFEMLMTM